MGVHGIHNYQHPTAHQQYSQHHANIQQDHNAHTNNGGILGHHTTYSSGLLSSTTPNFTPSNLQNGNSGTTRGGQAQQITEHWAKQLELHKESERAHALMADGQTHHYARAKATENRGLLPPANQPTTDEDDITVLRMSDQSASQRRQAWHSMDLSGQGLRVLAKPLFSYDFLKELYVASNKLTVLPPSISKLRFLEYLDASNNQLQDLPPELGICVFLRQLLLFDNRITTLPHELGYLFKLEMLGIEGNPLDPALKEVIMEKGTKELIEQLLESAPVPMPPNPRAILTLQEIEAPNVEKFKVFSYNILSEGTCTRAAYGYSPKGALAWDHRKEQILQEIQGQDADFVCLQEIGTDTFKEYFSMKLAYSEYKGIFWPRTRSRTMSAAEAKVVDGCAIFYKYKKFILLDKQLIDFGQIGINRQDMKGQRDMFNRIMNRDHIGIMGFFENRLTGSRIIMATTHLFWDPRFSDVKLVQAALLLAEINKFADKYVQWPPCEEKEKKLYTIADDSGDAEDTIPFAPEPSKEYSSKTQIPLVICADQNSGPGSAIYELLVKGSLPRDHNDIKDFSYGNLTKDGIEHPFSLKSAYSNLERTLEELPWTNFTPGFRDNIDHIWYSTNVLENTSLLGQVDPEYMKMVPGFPNYHYPSDHISLMAEFSIKPNKVKKPLAEPDFGPSSRSNDRRRN